MNKITLGFFRTKSTATIKTIFVLFVMLLMNTQTSWGQISITGLGTGNTYTENFNTLSNTVSSSTVPASWTFIETDTNANTTYAVDNGSNNSGNTYSYGTTSASDRSFGVVRSSTLISLIGVSFTNNSGSIISELVVSYTGEQWRLAVVSRVDRIDFQYSLDATSLLTGAWTDVNSLDFTAPVTTGAIGAKDGNVAPNRTGILSTITGLAIAPGATFWLRFNDIDASGADDGLAVDDFSMYAKAAPVITLSAATLTGFSATTTSPSSVQTINVSGANLTANVIVTPSLTNFEISTLPTSGFGSSITLPQVSGAVASTPIYVRLKPGVALGPISEAATFTSGTGSASLTCTGGVFTNYYYNGTGLLTDVASWDTDLDGIGTNPPVDFTTANQLFEIRNNAAVALSGVWDVGITPVGINGAKVRLGNNSEAAVTLTLNSGASIGPTGTGNFDVATPVSGNQTVIYNGTTALSFGNIFDNDLAVIYDGGGAIQSSSTTRSFGTVSLINGANVTFTATPVIKNINVDATSTLVAPTSAPSYITVPTGGSVVINGIMRVPKLTGFVTSGVAPSSLGGDIQFVGTENLTLGASSTVEYLRDATGPQIVTARTDYKNLSMGGTVPKTIAGNTSVAGTMTIVSGSGIATVNSLSNLTVAGAIVNDGTLIIANNANLIQNTGSTYSGSGTAIVNRNSNSLFRLDYTLWSSPVTGQNLLNFSPLTVATRFYDYDTNLNLYTAVLDPSTTTFVAGKGNLIRMPDTGSANYVAGTETLTYNGKFTGVPNNGNVQVTLSGFSNKYNLVGNPYPSTIDADAFIDHNEPSVIESTIYFWRKKNNPLDTSTAYATYNLVGGVGPAVGVGSGVAGAGSAPPNGTIQVGQGFFVQAKFATTAANFFTNAMRLPSSSTQFFKTKKVVNKDRIWLNLTNTSGVFTQMLVGYLADATSGLDRYDGKYINDSPIALTSNINNEEYTIQGRPTFDASDVVALNFKTDVDGDYTIAIDHVDGLFSGNQDIYLVDSKTGTETNLKTNSYTFTAAAVVDNTRFSLKYQKTLKVDAAAFNDNSVIVYKNAGVIYVNSGAKMMNNIKVYDIQGRLIAERNNVKANTTSIQNLRASNQILIVKVTTDDNLEISKKVEN